MEVAMAEAYRAYHKRDLYSEVSARIVAELERGAAPWIKPWSATPGQNVPANAATGRPYSGCNIVLLWMAANAGYASPRFLTFKQAIDAGGNVRKGEHGVKVHFVKQLQVRDTSEPTNSDDATKIIPMLREYTVFNIAQCEGLPDKIVPPQGKPARNHDMRDATIDEFLACTRADIREGAGEAYFAPGADFISLPAFGAFKDAHNFYSTAFHEMGHWTGHKSRLDRQATWGKRFGDQAYAAEELVAELCAAFLCAEFDLDGDLCHAGYIGNWNKLLKSDARAFFTACSKAQAAHRTRLLRARWRRAPRQ
jgi:antirestriction protein ArdC